MKTASTAANAPSFRVCPILVGKTVIDTIESTEFDPTLHPLLRYAKPLQLPAGAAEANDKAELAKVRHDYVLKLNAWSAVLLAFQSRLASIANHLDSMVVHRLSQVQDCDKQEQLDALLAQHEIVLDPLTPYELATQWLLNRIVEGFLDDLDSDPNSSVQTLARLRESRAFFDDHKLFPLLKFADRSTRAESVNERWPWPQRHQNVQANALQLGAHILEALQKTCSYETATFVQMCREKAKALFGELETFNVSFTQERATARNQVIGNIAQVTGDKRLNGLLRRAMPAKEAALQALQTYVREKIVEPAITQAIRESADESIKLCVEDIADFSNSHWDLPDDRLGVTQRDLISSPSLGMVCLMDAIDQLMAENAEALMAMGARYRQCSSHDLRELVAEQMGECISVGFRLYTPVFISEHLVDWHEYSVGLPIGARV